MAYKTDMSKTKCFGAYQKGWYPLVIQQFAMEHRHYKYRSSNYGCQAANGWPMASTFMLNYQGVNECSPPPNMNINWSHRFELPIPTKKGDVIGYQQTMHEHA